MRLEIGVPDYDFKGKGEPVSAKIVGIRGKGIPIQVIPHHEMIVVKKQHPHVRGIPTKVSFEYKLERLWFHPTPQGNLEVEVVSEQPKSQDKTKGIVGTITKAVLKGS